jgi:hypothetical protein
MSLLRTSRASECDGKRPFETRVDASKVAKRLGAANVYRCPHCHQFHVGHKTPRPPVRQGRRPVIAADDLDV